MLTYQDIIHQVGTLTTNEQLRLLDDLAAIIRTRMRLSTQRSIMELEGLGKEVWQKIDAQEYINQERDSWKKYGCSRM